MLLPSRWRGQERARRVPGKGYGVPGVPGRGPRRGRVPRQGQRTKPPNPGPRVGKLDGLGAAAVFNLALHRTLGVDEIDTQISHEPLRNHGNQCFSVEIDGFRWKTM